VVHPHRTIERRYSDVTEVLARGYWPSYNVPYHDSVYKVMGCVTVSQVGTPVHSVFGTGYEG
jgi:hypothetical protein